MKGGGHQVCKRNLVPHSCVHMHLAGRPGPLYSMMSPRFDSSSRAHTALEN